MNAPTLYILDDDTQYADLLAVVASNAGWEVIVETNPVNFLEKDLSKIELLVLDLHMPEMDGIEVIRAIAEQGCNITLILVSGFDARVLHSAEQLAKAHYLKVAASLTKPVPIDTFLKVLNAFENEEPSKPNSILKDTIKVDELEKAIENDELVIHYQPQVNIMSGELSGVEALLRWEHPEQGMIFPNQFIALAEENNLINALTERVIYLAVTQNKQWCNEGLNTSISVNISAENIIHLNLPEKLKKLTEQYDINSQNIVLELTESSVMGKLTTSLDVLNRLRMKGFSLSIDDFGTGYSSLSHLYQAPFTELKIDQKFIMHMLEDTEAMVIVKICIMLGHMLGMDIVAEGVETQEIFDELKEMGCDVAQGYFLSRPIPADDLINWVNSRR